MIFTSLGLAFVFGASLTVALLSYFFQCQWMEFTLEIWGSLAFLSAGGLGISLYFLFRKKKRKKRNFELEVEAFQKECKMAIRGHLKASILFWIHFYKKERVKSFDDAKKEIFHDLKKEFSDVRWMESMLEDIRQELVRYRGS